jgi:hypothetical protein
MTVPYDRITRQTAVNMTVTVPLRPADVEWTVCGRYGQHPYPNRTVYGRNRIRVRWPALLVATSNPKFDPIPRACVIFNHSLCDIILGTLLWYRRLQTIADFDFRILEVHRWPHMTNSN